MGDAAPALKTMAGIWQEILSLDSVSETDDFFKLGGDSVAATVLMVHIEGHWGLLLDPIEIFDKPVLKDFAAAVDAMRGVREDAATEEAVI